MFQSVTAPRPPRRFAFRLAVASGTLHLIGAAAMLVAAWWEIEELNRPTKHAVAGLALPRMGGTSPADTREAKKVEPKKQKRIAKDLHQPSATKVDRDQASEETPAASESGSGDGQGTGPGDGAGTGSGPGGPIGLITGCIDMDNCGDGIGDMPTLPVEPPDDEPKQVAPDVLSSLTRIVGDPLIQPPNNTKTDMMRSGKSRIVAVVRLCLDKSGAVRSARVASSSGYPDYDAKLVSKIRRWRYQPYRVNGRALSICSHIQFIYAQ